MVTTHRVSKIAVTVCLVAAPFMGMPVAAQAPASAGRAASLAPPSVSAGPSAVGTSSRFTLEEPISSIVTPATADRDSFDQRWWGRGRGGRHNASRTAIILGSVAAVAGAAVLVYANRPECSATNHAASGCSYGTKVVGGAVLAGGVVSIAAGALTWGRR